MGFRGLKGLVVRGEGNLRQVKEMREGDKEGIECSIPQDERRKNCRSTFQITSPKRIYKPVIK